jgi:hypothetical protein
MSLVSRRAASHLAGKCLVLLSALGLVPLGGSAGYAATNASAPTPPVVGYWKVHAPQSGEIRGGHFTVTARHRFVRDFTVTFGRYAPGSCGSGTVSVLGKQQIYDATGTNLEHIHYSTWVVGENHPKAGQVIQPEKVTLERAGHEFTGGLSLQFGSPRGGQQPNSAGMLTFPFRGQPTCEFFFTFKKR